MKFLTPLSIQWLDPAELREAGFRQDAPVGRLTAPLKIEYKGEVIEIPVGFTTDHASVPRIFWNLFPPYDSRYAKAAVLHDYGYQTGGGFPILPSDLFGERKTLWILGGRASVDKLFLDAMKAQGTAWISRHLIYRAVRIGGWIAWNRYRSIENSK